MATPNVGDFSSPLRRCSSSLPVVAVSAFVCFVYYTVVFLVIGDESWRRGTVPHVLLFTGLTLMAMLSYALSILRDPGSVPRTFTPDVEERQHHNPQSLHQAKRKVCPEINLVGMGNRFSVLLFDPMEGEEGLVAKHERNTMRNGMPLVVHVC
jgi:hypothetical protein